MQNRKETDTTSVTSFTMDNKGIAKEGVKNRTSARVWRFRLCICLRLPTFVCTCLRSSHLLTTPFVAPPLHDTESLRAKRGGETFPDSKSSYYAYRLYQRLQLTTPKHCTAHRCPRATNSLSLSVSRWAFYVAHLLCIFLLSGAQSNVIMSVSS